MPDARAEAVELLTHDFATWGFNRRARSASPAAIRLLLERKHPPTLNVTFLRLLVDPDAEDAPLVAQWQRALEALLDLETTYGWGSKQKRVRLTRLATDPELLEALQGATANADEASLEALAVLAMDAGEASLDAFLPHFLRAVESGGSPLRWLRRLRTFVKPGSVIEGFLDRAEAEAEEA